MACRLKDHMSKAIKALEGAGLQITGNGYHKSGHPYVCITDGNGHCAKLSLPHSSGDTNSSKFVVADARRALAHGIHP